MHMHDIDVGDLSVWRSLTPVHPGYWVIPAERTGHLTFNVLASGPVAIHYGTDDDPHKMKITKGEGQFRIRGKFRAGDRLTIVDPEPRPVARVFTK